ncbi:hypothetical protein MJO28_011577 [Puccinia striiformis f. sp. tritici]|uniref:Uncharacterized protein n=1 Tax=Puccinia striiformis f. sp. tritici TaxID=168172 RepID=A0ACC0E443_9BASI|nr:hypothetical protein MJO28_011577 [Puccinia striiformis f. sp. tritici]
MRFAARRRDIVNQTLISLVTGVSGTGRPESRIQLCRCAFESPPTTPINEAPVWTAFVIPIALIHST